MISCRQFSLGYATTKRSEPPPVRGTSSTAYRTSAISTESFTTPPPLCRFRYRRPKLNHLAPLGQRDPLRLLVKSRRNIELDYPCHGEPPMYFPATPGREAIQMPKMQWLFLVRHFGAEFSRHMNKRIEDISSETMKALYSSRMKNPGIGVGIRTERPPTIPTARHLDCAAISALTLTST